MTGILIVRIVSVDTPGVLDEECGQLNKYQEEDRFLPQ